MLLQRKLDEYNSYSNSNNGTHTHTHRKKTETETKTNGFILHNMSRSFFKQRVRFTYNFIAHDADAVVQKKQIMHTRQLLYSRTLRSITTCSINAICCRCVLCVCLFFFSSLVFLCKLLSRGRTVYTGRNKRRGMQIWSHQIFDKKKGFSTCRNAVALIGGSCLRIKKDAVTNTFELKSKRNKLLMARFK